ncbi:MAG: class F sortase [Candidatus Dormibacteraceae bacterium]
MHLDRKRLVRRARAQLGHLRPPAPRGRTKELFLALLGVALGASLVVVGINVASAVLGTSSPPAASRIPTAPKGTAPAPIPTATAAPAPATPTALSIPAIGVQAQVEDVGLDATGAMAVPSNIDDTAWYDDGPAPGQAGDAVLDGHLDWYTGPAVFWNLANLHAGDTISVTMSSGSRLNFDVETLQSYPYTSAPPGLFSTSGPPRLSLITCAGQWDAGKQIYSNRLVVTAAPAT